MGRKHPCTMTAETMPTVEGALPSVAHHHPIHAWPTGPTSRNVEGTSGTDLVMAVPGASMEARVAYHADIDRSIG